MRNNKNSVRQKNTYHCLHTNTTDIAVPEKQTIDQDTIPMKPTKTTDSWTNTNISNNKTNKPRFSRWKFINYFKISSPQ